MRGDSDCLLLVYVARCLLSSVLDDETSKTAEVYRLLVNQEPVYLRGFGSFIIKERAEKTARDIHKETTLIIPAHNIPAFKPAKTFMNDVKK